MTNFTGASIATYIHVSHSTPLSSYCQTVYPNPCRVVYGIGPRAGRGRRAEEPAALSSSRT